MDQFSGTKEGKEHLATTCHVPVMPCVAREGVIILFHVSQGFIPSRSHSVDEVSWLLNPGLSFFPLHLLLAT